MGIWLGPRGKPASKLPPEFTATGTLGTDYLYAEEEGENGTIYWEIAVLNPCAFTFSRVGNVDMTLVGAGKKGGIGQCILDGGVLKADGGYGGDGGDVFRSTAISLSTGVSYLVNVGASNGAATTVSAGGETLYSSGDGASVAPGGRGARQYAQQAHVEAGNGDPGVEAFASGTSLLFPGVKFGPGGGGGAAASTAAGTGYGRGTGGVTGGGDGGDKDDRLGYDGAANRGAGAGGGFGGFNNGSYNGGGVGGSGIALFRGAR